MDQMKNETMTFHLNEKETRKYKRFQKHKCSLKGNTGAIGGELNVEFTITSLGPFASVVCDCGKSRSLTDWDKI